jgi:Mg2+ and Co2+ transporter CorA
MKKLSCGHKDKNVHTLCTDCFKSFHKMSNLIEEQIDEIFDELSPKERNLLLSEIKKTRKVKRSVAHGKTHLSNLRASRC